MSWRDGGLKQKFIVLKKCKACGGTGESNQSHFGHCLECDGKGFTHADPSAQYFVLRIDCDPETGEAHDQTARDALYHYAIIMLSKNKEFGEDILRWLEETSPNRWAKEEKSTN